MLHIAPRWAAVLAVGLFAFAGPGLLPATAQTAGGSVSSGGASGPTRQVEQRGGRVMVNGRATSLPARLPERSGGASDGAGVGAEAVLNELDASNLAES